MRKGLERAVIFLVKGFLINDVLPVVEICISEVSGVAVDEENQNDKNNRLDQAGEKGYFGGCLFFLHGVPVLGERRESNISIL